MSLRSEYLLSGLTNNDKIESNTSGKPARPDGYNTDDSLFQAFGKGFMSAAGNAIHTINDAKNYMGVSEQVSSRPEWVEENITNSPISRFGRELEEEYQPQYKPLSANSIAAGLGGLAPYMAGLGILGTLASRTGQYQLLGANALTAATRLGLPARASLFASELAPAMTYGAIEKVPESLVERQGAYDDYIQKAKENGTYVQGETEKQANEVADRVLRDNIALLTTTGAIEQMALGNIGKTKGAKALIKGLFGNGFTNMVEETGQQIFPKMEAGEAWSLSDPDVLESALVGWLSGFGMHGAGVATDRFLSRNENKDSDGSQLSEKAASQNGEPSSAVGDNDDNNTTPPSGGATANARAVYERFKQRGFSDSAIAGIMGRVQQEHNFNTSNVEEYDDEETGLHLGGYGMFQWNGGRTQAFLEWAKENGRDPQDPYTQADYAIIEADERGLTPELMNNMTAEDAADLWTDKWEVGERGNEREYAREHLQAIQSGAYGDGSTSGAIPVSRINANFDANAFLTAAQDFTDSVTGEEAAGVTDYFRNMFEDAEKGKMPTQEQMQEAVSAYPRLGEMLQQQEAAPSMPQQQEAPKENREAPATPDITIKTDNISRARETQTQNAADNFTPTTPAEVQAPATQNTVVPQAPVAHGMTALTGPQSAGQEAARQRNAENAARQEGLAQAQAQQLQNEGAALVQAARQNNFPLTPEVEQALLSGNPQVVEAAKVFYANAMNGGMTNANPIQASSPAPAPEVYQAGVNQNPNAEPQASAAESQQAQVSVLDSPVPGYPPTMTYRRHAEFAAQHGGELIGEGSAQPVLRANSGDFVVDIPVPQEVADYYNKLKNEKKSKAKAKPASQEKAQQENKPERKETIAEEKKAAQNGSDEAREAKTSQTPTEKSGEKSAPEQKPQKQKKKEENTPEKASAAERYIDKVFPAKGSHMAAIKNEVAQLAAVVNPNNWVDGLKDVRADYKKQIDKILQPAIEALQKGFGNKVRTYQDPDTGRWLRETTNAQWYREFFAEHKRQPNKSELREMARQLILGDANAPQVEGWTATSKDVSDKIKKAGEQLTDLEQHLKACDAIKPKLAEAQKKFKAQQRVASKPQPLKQRLTNAINKFLQSAWHGSGALFDYFDLSYLGTGEGAQAHGYGVYTSEQRGVAEGYKKRLEKRAKNNPQYLVKAGDKEIVTPGGSGLLGKGLSDSEFIAATALTLNDVNKQNAIADIFDEISLMDSDVRPEYKQSFYDAIRLLKEDKVTAEKTKANSALYHVEIPDSDVMLDEQKELSQQPEKVQKAVKGIIADRLGDKDGVVGYVESKYGKELADKIRNHFATDSSLDYKESIYEDGRSEEERSKDYYDENGAFDPLKALTDSAVGTKESLREEIKKLPDGDYILARISLVDSALKNKLEYNDFWAERDFNDTGRGFYKMLSSYLGGDKAASELLNKYGIEGITYDGYQDGRCYVIFNDKAISILERLEQAADQQGKGEYDIVKRLISIFKSADASTVPHELSHWFTTEQEEIANVVPNSKIAKQLDAAYKWAEWKPGDVDAFKGTATYDEFKEYDKNIREAQKNGDETAERHWKEVWKQEKLARAFEDYLKDGKAPTKGLKGIFKRFKDWLMDIYRAFKGAGMKPSKEVKQFFDSVLATEEELRTGEDMTMTQSEQEAYDAMKAKLTEDGKLSEEDDLAARLAARIAYRMSLAWKAAGQDKSAVSLLPGIVRGEDEAAVARKEFERQKAEVRKKYQGTKQWLKAPNGKDTNLTEEQWVTVRTENFKRWFGDWENDPENASKVVDENGEPKVVYHGTVSGWFNTFKKEYGNVEGDMGARFYFTDSKDDVARHYEDGGPDFENKVERLAERIQQDEDISYDEAYDKAKEQLYNESALYDVFLNIKNPANVQTTMLFTDEVEAEDVSREDYDTEDEYYEAQQEAQDAAWGDTIESIVDRIEAEGYDADRGTLSHILYEAMYEGGIKVGDLKKNLNDLYIEDDEGNLASNEVMRLVIEELGYDGIIDPTVSTKFKRMELNPDTTHYIAFNSEQIKSSTENNGQFSNNDGNIYHQFAGKNAKTADKMKLAEAERMKENGATAKEIYKETGWLQGKDDKWRFEIKDHLDKINFKNLIGKQSAKLSEIYDNPELYKAYPWLKNVIVKATPKIPTKLGSYSLGDNSVEINKNLLKNNPGRARKTLIHEIQHAIQYREGFAVGGNAESAQYQALSARFDDNSKKIDGWDKYMQLQRAYAEGKTVDKEMAELKKALTPFKFAKLEEAYKKFRSYEANLAWTPNSEIYNRLGGEQEARAAANRAAIQNDIAQTERDIEAAKGDEEKLKQAQFRKRMLERQLGDMPTPHGEDAIIVFDGKEMPYSEEESSEREANPSVERANKLDQDNIKKAASKIEVRQTKNPKAISLKDLTVSSPSRIAEKYPAFKPFFEFADKAMKKLTKLREEWGAELSDALRIAKDKESRQSLYDILWKGDAEGKEYTDAELQEMGASDDVIKAYKSVRSLMDKVYDALNDARRRPQVKTKTMSEADVAALKDNPFVIKVLSDEKQSDGSHKVTWREYQNWEADYVVDKDTYEKFKKDPAIQILKDKKLKNGDHALHVRESISPLTKKEGYIPHFFHNFRVILSSAEEQKLVAKREDLYKKLEKADSRKEKNAIRKDIEKLTEEIEDMREENTNSILGSFRTLGEAMKYAKEHEGELPEGAKLIISPKTFNFKALGQDNKMLATVLGDKDYDKVMRNIAANTDMTVAEAKEAMDGIRKKNRHRFNGNFLQRKGYSGFVDDMEWVLRHHINSSARYVAMETEFKPKAINLFERMYGDFRHDYDGLADYTKDYINDVNGVPSNLEKAISDTLNNWSWWKNNVVSHFGDRAALQLAGNISGAVSIAKLGMLNISSAMINLTQLANAAAYIGDVNVLWNGLRRGAKGIYGKYSDKDQRVLDETGVAYDIGLDSGSGYDKFRPGDLAAKSMWFFKTSEETVRRGTVLAAYDAGIKRGMSHEEAIRFADEVNRKSNFEYGVQDAPNVFRRGSILSQLLLQFKKYPIKELEVMGDMLSSQTSGKQKAIFWGTYFMLAGLFQVPFGDWFEELAELIGLKPGPTLRKWMMTAAGNDPMKQTLAKMAMYGIGAGVNVDISQRYGLGGVLPTDLYLGKNPSTLDLIGNLGGASVSTARDVYRLLGAAARLDSDAALATLRGISPGVANMVSAYSGKTFDKRGRVATEYNTPRDRILKALGFRSADEAAVSDIRSIYYDEKEEKTQEKQRAIDKYLNEPTTENAKRLKELGVKPATVKKARQQRKLDNLHRTEANMSKQEKKDYKDLLKFTK